MGNVAIGTSNSTEKLAVNGKIRAQEIKVEGSNWLDYVFKDDYQLPPLEEVEKHIKVNKHFLVFLQLFWLSAMTLNTAK